MFSALKFYTYYIIIIERKTYCFPFFDFLGDLGFSQKPFLFLYWFRCLTVVLCLSVVKCICVHCFIPLIFSVSASSGTALPCSHAETFFTETPSAAANLTWDSPVFLRISRMASGVSGCGFSSSYLGIGISL